MFKLTKLPLFRLKSVARLGHFNITMADKSGRDSFMEISRQVWWISSSERRRSVTHPRNALIKTLKDIPHRAGRGHSHASVVGHKIQQRPPPRTPTSAESIPVL